MNILERDKVVVVGGGGHAKVILDILHTIENIDVVGFTAQESNILSLYDIPYLGDDSVLPALLEQGVTSFIIAIGDNNLRRKLYYKMLELGFTPVNAISPSAIISTSAQIGKGVAIMPGVVVNSFSQINDNVIINTRAGIDHDCIIGAHAHVAPGATLAGSVSIGEGTFIGTGCSVIPEITIGNWTVVGAGSTVISALPSNVKVVGVPAKKFI
ncbi:hypothetical protein BBD42_01955 [Paenibacillus sp. BIHB 4019]|uniref:PglD N-terminal domain-containing protein n=1 Tax=Paenibacillus sp. BIHB 4019 TaxID=1870819 RepID=A0A1B2DCC2_9BACL|nr:acetyltransferase [Paenibacillus sp. BIHB 4019]ANY65370.1 hypothetical protein BBD42_01955 [Paenibacillus sp. BIHB 4019]